MARNDARFLVVARGVAGELEDLSAEVLEDRSEVDGRTRTDAGRELAFLEESAHTADRELKTRLGRSGGRLAASLSAATALALARAFARTEPSVWAKRRRFRFCKNG